MAGLKQNVVIKLTRAESKDFRNALNNLGGGLHMRIEENIKAGKAAENWPLMFQKDIVDKVLYQLKRQDI